jgi:excinuclease ABC subunit C
VTLPDAIAQKLESLPASPGCYLFRDRGSDVLYVGKAKSLRARVRSYFQPGSSDTRAFIPHLLRLLGDLETIVTATEKEAAILENNLIKEHRPRYNVKLRDDKDYLTLRLRLAHPWPRLELVRRPTADQARYFGPYHSATAARRTLHLVEKHFQLRTCSDRELGSRQRPCLQYQIKRCPAPCVLPVDPGQYAQQVHAVTLFLDGRHDELTRELEQRMEQAAQRFEYELAALYRDQLRAVQSLREQQRVVSVSDQDQDVLGLYRQGDLVELAVLYVRAGRVVDAGNFSRVRAEVGDEEVVAAFVRQHYGEGGTGSRHIPAGVADWLSERRAEPASSRGGGGRRSRLLAPARGKRRQLLRLATDNARHAFEEKRRAAEDLDQRLARLQERLRLPMLPRRIEGCDISHHAGRDVVGAVVALTDGVPDKQRYRTYHVQSAPEGDDYAAMYEVLARRFRRGRDADQAQGSAEWELPDLFVVDGGRGQLGVALTAAADLGLHDLHVVALAKERESPLGEELVDRVYLPGQKNPLPLRPHSAELFLLAKLRDEAHRFANRGRRQLGKRRSIASELDSVPGIGPKTRNALLKALGSVQGVRGASDDAILAVAGVSRRQLAALRERLGPPGPDQAPADAAGPERACATVPDSPER